MSYRAVLIDFYGTLVDEDDVHIARIAEQVARASPLRPDVSEVAPSMTREMLSTDRRGGEDLGTMTDQEGSAGQGEKGDTP